MKSNRHIEPDKIQIVGPPPDKDGSPSRAPLRHDFGMSAATACSASFQSRTTVIRGWSFLKPTEVALDKLRVVYGS